MQRSLLPERMVDEILSRLPRDVDPLQFVDTWPSVEWHNFAKAFGADGCPGDVQERVYDLLERRRRAIQQSRD